jgi:hypothetical protein
MLCNRARLVDIETPALVGRERSLATNRVHSGARRITDHAERRSTLETW